MNNKIALLIHKYLQNLATEEEKTRLKEWVEVDKKNEVFFKEELRVWNVYSKHNFENYDTEKAFNKFLLETHESNPTVSLNNTFARKLYPFAWYAAAIVLLISVVYFYNYNRSQNNALTIASMENEVILKLNDGTIKVLTSTETEAIIDEDGLVSCVQKKDLLLYKVVKESEDIDNAESLVYNEIKVPYGKKYELILSDGSHVWLNAGSQIKYPKLFNDGSKTRPVYLEGEAFFEVSKNASKPFIVYTTSMNVKVLGTKFDVSAYPEDAFVSTVLVEGSVNVFNPENSSINKNIIPNQLAVLEKASDSIVISEVNTDNYTAWVQNKFLFEDEPFSEIAKRIERHYNVKIINNYDSLNSIRFFGEFHEESIDEIFKTFSACICFDYSIINNTITINNRKE